MNVNIYLPGELGERVKKAELEISRICQDALSKQVEIWEASRSKSKAKLGRIEVACLLDGVRVSKAFVGRWLIQGERTKETGDWSPDTKWSVALTKRANFVVYTATEDSKDVDIYPSLQGPQQILPSDVYGAVEDALGVGGGIIELDI
jgi:post-segregation antitoxin (ccd killing protein)